MDASQVAPRGAGERLGRHRASSRGSAELTLWSFFCSGCVVCWFDPGMWTPVTLRTSPPAAFLPFFTILRARIQMAFTGCPVFPVHQRPWRSRPVPPARSGGKASLSAACRQTLEPPGGTTVKVWSKWFLLFSGDVQCAEGPASHALGERFWEKTGPELLGWRRGRISWVASGAAEEGASPALRGGV